MFSLREKAVLGFTALAIALGLATEAMAAPTTTNYQPKHMGHALRTETFPVGPVSTATDAANGLGVGGVVASCGTGNNDDSFSCVSTATAVQAMPYPGLLRIAFYDGNSDDALTFGTIRIRVDCHGPSGEKVAIDVQKIIDETVQTLTSSRACAYIDQVRVDTLSAASTDIELDSSDSIKLIVGDNVVLPMPLRSATLSDYQGIESVSVWDQAIAAGRRTAKASVCTTGSINNGPFTYQYVDISTCFDNTPVGGVPNLADTQNFEATIRYTASRH